MATLLWMQAGSCSGDTMSLLCADDPDLPRFLALNGIDLLWQPSLTAEPVSVLHRRVDAILGGTLVSFVDWRAIFWVNIPVGLIAILLTLRFIPESKAPRPRRFDPVGQVLVLVMLASVTYGIIKGPNLGWNSTVILGAFSASALGVSGMLRAS